jgi:hypothetical protein
MINFDAKFVRHHDPFPYHTISDVLSAEKVHRLNAELPPLDLFKREIKEGAQHSKQYHMWRFGLYEDGQRAPRTDELPAPWLELLDSLLSEDFSTWASDGLGLDVRALTLTLGLYRYGDRDYTTKDTAKLRKAVQWALYLNEDWGADDGGALHFWTAKDAPEPTVSIVPVGGTCALFSPSPVTWHNIGTVTSSGEKERINIMIEYWKS